MRAKRGFGIELANAMYVYASATPTALQARDIDIASNLDRPAASVALTLREHALELDRSSYTVDDSAAQVRSTVLATRPRDTRITSCHCTLALATTW